MWLAVTSGPPRHDQQLSNDRRCRCLTVGRFILPVEVEAATDACPANDTLMEPDMEDAPEMGLSEAGNRRCAQDIAEIV